MQLIGLNSDLFNSATLIRGLLRIAVIGIGAMAGPGVLFVLPFLLPVEQFSSFAAVLAISQLISSLGGFGLDVSCPRLGIKLQRAAVYNLLSMLVAFTVVLLGFGGSLSEKLIMGGLIAWATSLSAIFHYYSLFAGKARLYGVIGLFKATIFLAVLVFSIRLGVNPVTAWFIAAISGLLVVIGLLMMNGASALPRSNSQSNWKDVIQFSAPMAMIVGMGALPFVLDRTIGQQVLSSVEFARYAVAVTWAVPIIYVGNVIQQSMIASKKDDSMQTVFYWAGGLFVLSLIYILFAGISSLYFIRVPYFADGKDFICLWGWIAGWYAIYSAITFPVAAVMQKHFSAIQLKKLAYVTLCIVASCLVFAYVLYTNFISWAAMENKTIAIILFTAFFAVIGVSAKTVFVVRYLTR